MKKNILLAIGAFIVIGLLFVPLLDFFYDLGGFAKADPRPFTVEGLFAGRSGEGGEIFPVTVATSAEAYEDLPVGEVSFHEIADPKGTVVLIPQNHQYPGSAAEDPKNDSAEKTQAQIYDILKHLHEENGIDFIMTEGDLNGDVPAEKLAALAEKIDLRDEFAVRIEKLRVEADGKLDPGAEKNLLVKAEKLIASLDREIILKGAPYKLKAEGVDFKLVGSENEETREECADIVRNYIYQQDQLKTCNGLAAGNDSSVLTGNGTTAATQEKLRVLKDKLKTFKDLPLSERLKALQTEFKSKDLSFMIASEDLNGLTGGNSLLEKIRQIKTLSAGQVSLDKEFSELLTVANARGEKALTDKLTAAKEAYQKIEDFKSGKQGALTSSSPSRSDNPYKTITDPVKLQTMIKESEGMIQTVVIDQRNRETAVNFVSAMETAGEKIGILQFGAGHEEGLIKELNNQALNVIVIKADEVLRREKTGE
ncbi:hypothetical protein A2303_03775 [Candidatus Falkowbacteria bacterium RIFOXYB2_FULL_47_14]|uniref:Uncharacterized protein n=1 Tax=Candidatus Falkowbacteria bacterium RIFOXYA2_FULL_47_19 TaxID=1797994 RepID=A0A1F5SHY7_9BACT|nr:MAG: hypothetical protein A2227_03320 [Candidatus Falkowbacteria bacterium RIFOXYA2_FULL_47_19]OGF37263.1 MAG: hypothetical protein A2468_06615 [Candidatus Falkowbacteria bacterium RIFOXYC2_FULL_46_15]OGF42515.1 MAG: hypothetical protein A2303_03775 [Candidatus Falkowbacteria bacterium RIFOXYB2_FULL_47_14]